MRISPVSSNPRIPSANRRRATLGHDLIKGIPRIGKRVIQPSDHGGWNGLDLPDVEWLVISALLPNKPRGVARVDDRCVLNADGRALGRHSGALWSAHDLREPFQQVAQGGRLGSAFGSCVKAYDGDIQMIEWSSIRLHQHAANAQKRRSIRGAAC
jgi:hypothetical protein